MKTLVALCICVFGFMQITLGQIKENNSFEKLEKSIVSNQLVTVDTGKLNLKIPGSKIQSVRIGGVQNLKSDVGSIEIPNAYPKMLASGKDNSVILMKKMDIINQAPMPGTGPLNDNIYNKNNLNQLVVPNIDLKPKK